MPAQATLPEPQSAAAVLMVRPAHFGFNPQTAPSNAFQQAPAAGARGADLQARAVREFDLLAERLAGAGVQVIVAEDTDAPPKPDAVFPNNWVSFHRDGTVVLYPLLAPNRRSERREELLRQVTAAGHFRITRTVDLSKAEQQGKFLEGTGSLVLDRIEHLAFAALSPRTDLDLLGEFAQQLDYELVTFDATDGSGRAVYHTNVLMAIGSRFAVLCPQAIDERQRPAVHSKLAATGREIIDITLGQMHSFAGNVLELTSAQGPLIALSGAAWRSLKAAQRRRLERHAGLLKVDIPTIERSGGGSVRCMLAEVHLPGA